MRPVMDPALIALPRRAELLAGAANFGHEERVLSSESAVSRPFAHPASSPQDHNSGEHSTFSTTHTAAGALLSLDATSATWLGALLVPTKPPCCLHRRHNHDVDVLCVPLVR